MNIFRLEARSYTIMCTLFISRSIFITGKNSRCQMIPVKSKNLCKKLEAPLTSFFLEIVSKAPATHHLKEGNVALIAYRIYIICTNTALYIAESCSHRMLLSQKIWHKWLHSGYVKHNACRTV